MGYEKDLLILPFDHRGSLLKKLYGIEGRTPTEEEAKDYADLKYMVYEGFLKSLKEGVEKEKAAILVDEQFCSEIIKDAKSKGIMVAMPTEKSGQKEFDFEHPDFKEHIKRVDPTFVKVLVRYNVEGNKETNERQIEKLKRISDYCKEINKHLIFELLVPAEPSQEAENYDRDIRPGLMVRAILELQDKGVEPAVWKLEGVEKQEDSKALVEACQRDGRNAGIITLGRGENAEKVKEWLKVGAKQKGIIGFAVGRTVFWEPMKALYAKEISRDEAIQQVTDNYKSLVDLWNSERE